MHRRGKSSTTKGRRNSLESDSSSCDECDHSSNEASSDDDEYESSSSDEDSFSSDDCDSQGSYPEETLYQRTAKSVVRRRAVSPLDSSESIRENDGGPRHSDATTARTHRNKRAGRERHTAPPSFFQECFMFYRDACPFFCNRRASITLLLCFLIWFGVQINDAWRVRPRYRDPMNAVRRHSSKARNRLRNRDNGPAGEERMGLKEIEPHGFWHDAQETLERLMPNSRPRKKNSGEKLPPGCKRTEWQKLSFPNCNAIHELDLREELGLRRSRTAIERDHNATETFGYVGSGLWRTVWKVRGHENIPLVIKLMKGEHDVDSRNMDRHRRDALSMERLTSSPNIVSIYGYCGNTVLTEHLPRGLDTLVYHDGDKKQSETIATRQTPLGRLRLALHVARGVAAIHDLPGGPIIHADIQAKQFLVDSQGVVKLNDFNRCRFMSNGTKTGTPCHVTIPSAPGSSRSPEEYKYERLTEKLDVFSTAHVLYAILTGEKPWDDLWGTRVKELVKAGNKPTIVDKKYLKLGTSDAALANLIDLAYETDPKDRVSASQLVAELELLIATEDAKQIGNHFATL